MLCAARGDQGSQLSSGLQPATAQIEGIQLSLWGTAHTRPIAEFVRPGEPNQA
jgi:hypothetical protein